MVCRKWAPGVLFQFLFSLSISIFYIIHVHIYKKIEFERLIEIERELHGAKKMKKKFFFRKTGLPAKPEYPENHETSETFFPDSFLKLNSLQAHMKKNSKSRLPFYVMSRS